MSVMIDGKWDTIDKLKFKLLQAQLSIKVIEDAIEAQLHSGHKVSYKTIKYMKKDLHNKLHDSIKLTKKIKKLQLRESQEVRRL